MWFCLCYDHVLRLAPFNLQLWLIDGSVHSFWQEAEELIHDIVGQFAFKTTVYVWRWQFTLIWTRGRGVVLHFLRQLVLKITISVWRWQFMLILNQKQRCWSQIFCDCFYVRTTVYDDFSTRQRGWSQIFCDCFYVMMTLAWGKEVDPRYFATVLCDDDSLWSF